MNNLAKLFYLFCMLFIFSNCIPDCIKHYTFEVPLEISPQESYITVGDTMYVSMVTDNLGIYDTLGNRMVQFPEFDPNAIFQLPIIDSFPVKEGLLLNEVLVDTFIYKAQIRNTEHLGLGLFFFDIPKNENESRIEFRVVLNTPGLYMLACRDALPFSDMTNERIFPDRCGHDGVLEVYYNIPQGNHKDLLSDSHFEVLNEYWKYSSGDKGGVDEYYFKVLE